MEKDVIRETRLDAMTESLGAQLRACAKKTQWTLTGIPCCANESVGALSTTRWV